MVLPLRYVLSLVLFNTVSLLYHYTINNNYMWYYICSAWFLVIRISTCCGYIFTILFLNQARAWFLEIDPVRIVGMRVCVRVCVCVYVRTRGY